MSAGNNLSMQQLFPRHCSPVLVQPRACCLDVKGETERHKNGEVCKATCSFIPFYKGGVFSEGRPVKAVSTARNFSQQSAQNWKGLRLPLMMGPVWEQFLFKELLSTYQCLCFLLLCQQDSGCVLLRPRVRIPCPAHLLKIKLTRKGKEREPLAVPVWHIVDAIKSLVSTACNS